MRIIYLYMSLLVVVRKEGATSSRCAEHNSPSVDVRNTSLNKRRSDKTLGFRGNSDLEPHQKRKYYYNTKGVYTYFKCTSSFAILKIFTSGIPDISQARLRASLEGVPPDSEHTKEVYGVIRCRGEASKQLESKELTGVGSSTLKRRKGEI